MDPRLILLTQQSRLVFDCVKSMAAVIRFALKYCLCNVIHNQILFDAADNPYHPFDSMPLSTPDRLPSPCLEGALEKVAPSNLRAYRRLTRTFHHFKARAPPPSYLPPGSGKAIKASLYAPKTQYPRYIPDPFKHLQTAHLFPKCRHPPSPSSHRRSVPTSSSTHPTAVSQSFHRHRTCPAVPHSRSHDPSTYFHSLLSQDPTVSASFLLCNIPTPESPLIMLPLTPRPLLPSPEPSFIHRFIHLSSHTEPHMHKPH